LIPPNYETHYSFAKAFLNTGVLAKFFTEVANEYGGWHPLDI
jgi:hypothetical protein